ncbi:Extradiol ring-cleavage dioxygenase, class III enzyme, subunit B [Pseudocohnilembus persalinus]|uniref:Extradiol ring-cleavage dioxygenase, class III enzyme, subunit B n=1 Tax=Pseudocohnilembus persalinus TaxID=266149 RepID=A0A0V0QZT0_PSEPJ|nr:Extradiol ring-cleavage dioxygenase, class III enzyme, subunit B [Pseudocohnilembus persalinus]|eukprot:KRX07794.1 Extradiol ring-cleavage dioxygenase, class III enzyme, subunit B [Pseudocohnilembus persalinus]
MGSINSKFQSLSQKKVNETQKQEEQNQEREFQNNENYQEQKQKEKNQNLSENSEMILQNNTLQDNKQSILLPMLYLSHGGPTTSFRDYNLYDKDVVNSYCDFLEKFGKNLRKNGQIKNIIVVSAHFERSKFAILQGEKPKTIHDHGFSEIFDYQSKSRNNLVLAQDLYEQLKQEGLEVEKEYGWGYDHGVWSITKLIDPDGEIPCLSISVNRKWDPQQHIKLGKILGKLRDENLIVASGSASHNLREFFTQVQYGIKSKFSQQIKSFNDQVIEILVKKTGNERVQKAVDLLKHKDYKINHPSDEHFFPVFVGVGAALNSKGKIFSYDPTGISTSLVFE